ncbi:glucose-1-phosphate cytidylyltransferase [Alphaproteobacteria bacterium]|nr:glucose-1-phosphate cytidylyltransferase [Alphaproteobacteria bacterium]
MKAVILAGGLGTRLAEETSLRPKPMVEVGGRPILWHIMKMYSNYGVDEFIICCGYKGYVIKEYFANYSLHQSDITFSMMDNSFEVHQRRVEPWKVTLVDTGDESMTGGRLLRVASYLADEEAFCLTYGDGVSDVNISNLIDFHKSHGKDATVTATYPPGRFGAMCFDGDRVIKFSEKPKGDGGMINGGFFVLSPTVLHRLVDDASVWEQEPLVGLAADQQLMAFKHEGFWQPMDTLRDKIYLENLWKNNQAPWKTWND